MATDEAKKIIAEVSAQNIDDLVRSAEWSNELEESVRGHIHQEFVSWFFFRKLAADCLRSNVALHGFALLWQRCAAACLIEGHWLEKYLVQRGGRSKPTDLAAPKIEWPDSPVEPVAPVREAFKVQKELLEDLERLATLSGKVGNNALKQEIESRYLHRKTRHVKEMGDLLQQTVRVSKQPGHGLFHLDQELRQHEGKIPWGHWNDPENLEKTIEDVTVALRRGL
ncbi:hypothetical protein VTO42DRAFT_2944 [Malbranchea cinnamomea]